MSLPTKEAQKPELIGDVGIATTSKSGPDVFGDIDKRLTLLLERANKLESTLNRLNEERADNDNDNSSDMDPDMELISGEDVEDGDYNLEVDDLDLDLDDIDNEDDADVTDSEADKTDKIDLNAHED